MDASQLDERLTDAIELVSHETRAGILVALAGQQHETPRNPGVRFADLRERVGHDDPGNFNYHLQRLAGKLVERTTDGYRLSDVGHHFVAVLLSGRFDPEHEHGMDDAQVTCPICHGDATVAFSDGLLRVDCDDGHTARMDVAPEQLARRSIEEVLNVGLWRNVCEVRSVIDGTCTTCGAGTESRLERTGEVPPVGVLATCDRCGSVVRNTVGGCVLDHPAVVSLCRDHGLDIRTKAWTVFRDHVRKPVLLDKDPVRAAVTVSVDDEGIELVLDASAQVVNVSAASGESGS